MNKKFVGWSLIFKVRPVNSKRKYRWKQKILIDRSKAVLKEFLRTTKQDLGHEVKEVVWTKMYANVIYKYKT